MKLEITLRLARELKMADRARIESMVAAVPGEWTVTSHFDDVPSASGLNARRVWLSIEGDRVVTTRNAVAAVMLVIEEADRQGLPVRSWAADHDDTETTLSEFRNG